MARKRPQDEIPEMVIIRKACQEYFKMQEANEKLAKYTRQLEAECKELRELVGIKKKYGELKCKVNTMEMQLQAYPKVKEKLKKAKEEINYLRQLLESCNIDYKHYDNNTTTGAE